MDSFVLHDLGGDGYVDINEGISPTICNVDFDSWTLELEGVM